MISRIYLLTSNSGLDTSTAHYQQGETRYKSPLRRPPLLHIKPGRQHHKGFGIQPQNYERQWPYEPLVRHKDVVDPAKLDVDLEAEVGKGLWGGFHHILDLDALCGHSQESVPNTLHFSCGQRKQMSTQAITITPLPAAPSGTGRERALQGRSQPSGASPKLFSPCSPQTHRTQVSSLAG